MTGISELEKHSTLTSPALKIRGCRRGARAMKNLLRRRGLADTVLLPADLQLLLTRASRLEYLIGNDAPDIVLRAELRLLQAAVRP
ncbi:hypothetical protein [Leisingera sp. McT4-56]|uniref:hypothetical protein n=1 Tax=Leisingera sp. McT4-56 TaxID=2881255 RepID=UPI001CF8529E|nr:hypothetical protein [Leisingera sp. McT4-56]MCB4454616.1 hypothetical protein [Leisingera sp. McT4-56]